MKWIEVSRPDGTRFRQQCAEGHPLPQLLPGYDYVGRVMFCDPDGKGGIVAPKGKTVLGVLLEECGDDLAEWLKVRQS